MEFLVSGKKVVLYTKHKVYHEIIIYKVHTKTKMARVPGTGRSSIRDTRTGYLEVNTGGADMN